MGSSCISPISKTHKTLHTIKYTIAEKPSIKRYWVIFHYLLKFEVGLRSHYHGGIGLYGFSNVKKKRDWNAKIMDQIEIVIIQQQIPTNCSWNLRVYQINDFTSQTIPSDKDLDEYDYFYIEK